jgi:hypothetical protein
MNQSPTRAAGSLMLSPQNIRFRYMYRDASNYKQHGEAIFTNPDHLSLQEIDSRLRTCLQDGEFFIARQVGIEERFFDALYDDDHPWHEFVQLEATTDPAFDPERSQPRSVTQFLAELEGAHQAGWDEMNVREDVKRMLERQKKLLQTRATT